MEDIIPPVLQWREDAVGGAGAVVDLDKIISDIEKLDEVSLSRRRHYGVDWRKVMQLRLKSEVFDPSENQSSFLTWKQLSATFGVRAS